MPLAEFKYIEKALATLDKKSEQLQIISTLLQIEFEQIVNLYDIEYLKYQYSSLHPISETGK